MAGKKKDKKKAPRKQRKSRAKPGKKKPKAAKKPAPKESKEPEQYKAEGPTSQTTAFLQLLAWGKIVFQTTDNQGNIGNELDITQFIQQLDSNIEEQGKGADISIRIRKELKAIQEIHTSAIKSLLPKYRTELVED